MVEMAFVAEPVGVHVVGTQDQMARVDALSTQRGCQLGPLSSGEAVNPRGQEDP